ncbi:6-phosphogluconate dehydrogenase, decarboxylating [Catenulispora acidiphila DSM 44928]|uniref:6-phosphogluconate dehydrogenase, decarboxylating n=1 Tax=Catenulispora acidiphila (strain DSM 44928 / JCM 14897 / NBRC 102108 / NRRL B-24433 / ID139908) TaxID=479433 RepID=C7PZA1_CATAD|nr:decarboxylating 6-phosphogluconate dehydrogenase [Catenulispora acidiphila]ACU71558.1 6-phosphogluconate dehydrogenase, decarboxylating [Catenulispora acidiphila DSM 44928]
MTQTEQGRHDVQLGMIGLGRMGADIVRRLMGEGHECVVYDHDPAAVEKLEHEGATGVSSLKDLAAQMTAPRAVWVMVPAGDVTTGVIEELAAVLDTDDIVIDGGNTYYRDDLQHAQTLAQHGVKHLDCGTSGGVFGRERGYCLMIGGEAEAVAHLKPIFETLAPGSEGAPRTPGREKTPLAEEEKGYLHCGPSGAGHFVKMIHNGIEYGMMASLAEGLNILRNADIGTRTQTGDAETAPMEHPEFYRYDIDTAAVTEVWRRGSVISSWLMDLTATALYQSPDLADFQGSVSDSGEGRWTSIAAIDEGVPAPVLTTALYSRFSSRRLDDFADRALSAMRKQFGGHAEKHDS